MRSAILSASFALLAACFTRPEPPGGIDPSAPLLIAVGGQHACRIVASELVCWGNNDHGQLGARTDVADFSGTPGRADPEVGWTSVAAGQSHTCGVLDGVVYCWGENFHRQSNPASQLDNITKMAVALPGAAERVFAAGHTTCAITVDHEAYCWGDLELRLVFPHVHPKVATRLGTTTFKHIAIADDHACAIADDGRVHCWGEAEQRQIGREGVDDLLFAAVGPIDSTELFTSLSSANEATCGITSGNKLACWGSINQGKLSDTAGSNNGYPFVILDDRRAWSAVAVGALHTCAVAAGDVYCFGDDPNGALGSGTFHPRRAMGPMVETGMKVAQVAAGAGFTCALADDAGAMKCWGSNGKGELGNHKFSRKYEPTQAMLPAEPVVQLIAGDHHTCALTGSGPGYTAYCWGLNEDRQIGSSSAIALHATPVEAAQGGTRFLRLALGEKHTCGILAGRTNIECWGANDDSQLGASTSAAMRNQIPAGDRATGWSAVAAGSRMTCGINSGALTCWGLLPEKSASPVPFAYFSPGGSWRSIAIGSGFAVGVTLGGTTPSAAGIGSSLKRCAAGLYDGQPPDKDGVAVTILSGFVFPGVDMVQPPYVSAAQANGEHSCFHHQAGNTSRVTCLGSPTLPQVTTSGGFPKCGIRDSNSVDVPGSWRAPDENAPGMFAMADQTCALDSTSKIRCWGINSNFELGKIAGGVPAEVFSRQWVAIAGGDDHTCGIAADDGKVYCWGENQYGQVGDGTSYEPSPVESGVP